MTTVAAIRERRRQQRIDQLCHASAALLQDPVGEEVWLFGSLARGDWDARSDVDLLAVAPDQAAAERLADFLLEAGLGDDVIALSRERWQQRKSGNDPWWSGICRDALRLAGGAEL